MRRSRTLFLLFALSSMLGLSACDGDEASSGDAVTTPDGNDASDDTGVDTSIATDASTTSTEDTSTAADTATGSDTATASDTGTSGDTATTADTAVATDTSDDTTDPADTTASTDTDMGMDVMDMGVGLPGGPSSQRHTKWPLGMKYADQGFWEYLPEGYGNGTEFPLLIFFHGLGENGDGGATDLDKLLSNGPPRYIDRDEWPIAASAAGDEFIVLSVQNSSGNCHKPDEIDAFIRWAALEYDVDHTRIYLTGLSCGAIGLFGYLNRHLDSDIVAASVPIAGNGTNAWNTHMCDLGVMPIWAFHGDEDTTVWPSGTHTPLDGLAACTDPAPVDAIKTIYEGVAHNSWSRTYSLSAGHDIYSWMLGHTNPDVMIPTP